MPRLTIEYGRKGGPRSGHIREGRLGIASPSFTVCPGETPPLRLNTDHGVRFPPELLSKLPENEEKLAYLKREIAGALDLFAPYQRLFLDEYFVFIAERRRDAAAAIARHVDWSGGLFRTDDFVFSALWPLPNATVTVSGDDGSKQALGDYDFVFWDGNRVIAITLGSRPPPPEAGVELSTGASRYALPITLVASELDQQPGPFAAARFPEEFVSFWSGECAPSSPFRPGGLALPADAIR